MANDFPTHFLDNREGVILEQFQRRAHNFISDPPPLEDRLEWLSLLQHYGGSTRLLDFTESFYVAAFFAMVSSTSDAAIWAINPDIFFENLPEEDQVSNETIFQSQARVRALVQKKLAFEKAECLALEAAPFRLNERMTAQKGMFIVPCEVNVSFEQNLEASIGVEKGAIGKFNAKEPCSLTATESPQGLERMSLVKIELPVEVHNEAIHDLEDMAVTYASLFPGLEGFARSLDLYLRDVV